MKILQLTLVILCVVVQLNVISGNRGKYHDQAVRADKAELSYGRNGHGMKRGATKRTKKISVTQRPIGWDTSSNNQQRPAAAAPPAYSPQQPAYPPQQPAYSPQQPAPPPYSPQYSPPQNQGPPPSYAQNPMQQPSYQPQPQVVNNYHPAPAQTGGSSGPGILGSVLIGGAAGLGGAALYDAFKPDDKVEEKPIAAVPPTVVADAVVAETVSPVVAAPAVVAPLAPVVVEGVPAVPALVEGTPLPLAVPDTTSTTENLSSDKPTIITDSTTILSTVNEASKDAEKQTIDCAGLSSTTKYSLNVLLISIIISIFY